MPGDPEHDPWGRRFCAATAAAAALVAVLCVGWPSLAAQGLPWSLQPLHTRCVGVMHGALALQLLAALRTLDPHSLRSPLAAVLAWCLAGATGVLLQHAPPGLGSIVWLVAWLLLALAAVLLLLRPAGLHAAAERPARAWQGIALVASVAAALLLLWPQQAVAIWPWPLAPAQAAAYAGPFLAFCVAAWGVARERRRYVQRPARQSLALLGAGVLATSLLHRALFDFQRPAAWVWFFSFAAVAVLALQPLRAARRCAWLEV